MTGTNALSDQAPVEADGPLDSRPRVGMRLGRYSLTAVLGSGAMSTVYRARDEKLRRDVAVKVMGLAFAARAESAERFRREAQAVAAVKHPGIVEIFDFAPAQNEDPAYLVVELIDGPTLRQVIEPRRGRMLPEVAALIVAHVADALAVAHARGIVHRDVKPDNVMIERAGSGSRVVLTDFGVAHVSGLETMTATGALVGSPAYMSPEQARGGDVSSASDVWALGALLYELCTGALPFSGKDPLAIVLAISKGQFKRPSQLSALVGPAVERVISWCMKTDPAQRPEHAGVVAQELHALARAAGVDERSLRRLLDDADGLETELGPRLADQAAESARKHVRAKEMGKALAEIGRAQTLVPGHAEAGRLLASLTARQRWRRVATGAAAVVALGGVVAGGGWLLRRRAPARTEQPAAVAASAKREASPKPAVVEMASAGRQEIAATATAPAKAETPRPTAARDRRKVQPRIPIRTAAPPASPPEPTATTAPPAPEPALAARPPPTPIHTAPPSPVEKVGVRLLATNFLCLPSLTGRAPENSPLFEVSPGTHTVYCTANARTVKAGVIDVPELPSARLYEVKVKWNDGAPVIVARGERPRRSDESR